MAYEVIKTIAGRAYRYRVESIQDPGTGKRRSRWTYLGRVTERPAVTAPRRPTDARRRLLDALERLLESRDFPSVTADAIATEAGLAHGTFYRHFRDKRDALRAALERVRQERAPAMESLNEGVTTEAGARAGLRAFVLRVLSSPDEHPALLRATYAMLAHDEELAQDRRNRKGRGASVLARHLGALTACGLANVRDPDATAGALVAMIDGLYRDAIFDRIPLDAGRIAAAAEVVERAVFG